MTDSITQPLWIDVRTLEEFNNGHLKDALNIDHEEIAGIIENVVPDKSQSIYLYCRSGNRSGIATNVLQSMGYTAVENLGGYEDLKQKYPFVE